MTQKTKDARRIRDLLEASFPMYISKRDRLNVPKLAHDIGCSQEALYRPLREGRMFPKQAYEILLWSRDCPGATTVYWEDLLPFCVMGYPELCRASASGEEGAEAAPSSRDDLDDLLS